MSRFPPSLLYLTIYNPTLRPDALATHEDDEDAHEQAQILFYTSRDRAVSRDRMLRQVGLAKALLNFAEIFHSTDPCQNVHSQSRRMVMVSPEPNFWMHVAIELARTPRAPTAKPKTEDKGKAKDEPSQIRQLEYHDGTLHDAAIRAHLSRGYEQFKLIHGSFSSILSSLGQQALELQLERFFTVWAWTWDPDKDLGLCADLALPLHPSYPLILPAIDDFSSQIPDDVAVLVLTHSHVAPSSRYRNSRYPVALARHIMNHITPTPGPATSPASTVQPEREDVGHGDDNDRKTLSNPEPALPSVSFLGGMDVRKWAWPSFRRGADTKGAATKPGEDVNSCRAPEHAAQVDQSALEDAISSDNSFGLPTEKPAALDGLEKRSESDTSETDIDTPRPSRVPSPTVDPSGPSLNGSLVGVEVSTTAESENWRFTSMNVFLAPHLEPLATCRRKIYLLKRGLYAVALLGNDLDDMDTWAEPTSRLLEDIEKIVCEESRRNMAVSLPSVTKILQPQDSHVLVSGDYVSTSGDAKLDSHHLFEAKRLLDREPAAVEVFSRGLHPQYWHVVSRVTDQIEDENGEAYLEVSRKEATLSDVDNILRGLYKTHA